MQGWADTRRRGLAAALGAVLVLGACSGSDDGSGDAGGDAGDAVEAASDQAVQNVTSARPLLSALADESVATGLGILGLQAAVEMPAGDLTAARRRTDEGLALLRASATGTGAQGGAAPYQATYEALDGLPALRGDVDAHTAPEGLNEMPFAADVQGRYAAVVDVLLDDLAAAAEAAPPDARVGAQLYVEGLRPVVLVPRLRFALVQGAMGSHGDPAWLSRTSTLVGQLQQVRGAVAGLASGTPYQEAATRLETELDAAGVDAVVDDALVTGEYNLAAILQSLRLDPGQGWMAFVDRVEEMLLA